MDSDLARKLRRPLGRWRFRFSQHPLPTVSVTANAAADDDDGMFGHLDFSFGSLCRSLFSSMIYLAASFLFLFCFVFVCFLFRRTVLVLSTWRLMVNPLRC